MWRALQLALPSFLLWEGLTVEGAIVWFQMPPMLFCCQCVVRVPCFSGFEFKNFPNCFEMVGSVGHAFLFRVLGLPPGVSLRRLL